MIARANPHPLSATQACQQAGGPQRFVDEVMAQVRLDLLQLHTDHPREELMSSQEVLEEIDTAIRNVLMERFSDDLSQLMEQMESGSHPDADAATDEVNAIIVGWGSEFNQLLQDDIKRKIAAKDAQ